MFSETLTERLVRDACPASPPPNQGIGSASRPVLAAVPSQHTPNHEDNSRYEGLDDGSDDDSDDGDDNGDDVRRAAARKLLFHGDDGDGESGALALGGGIVPSIHVSLAELRQRRRRRPSRTTSGSSRLGSPPAGCETLGPFLAPQTACAARSPSPGNDRRAGLGLHDDSDGNPGDVDHGPSRHFQMLYRAARDTGAPRPVFEGFLTKQGRIVRNWKRRWCILDETGAIRYYKPSEFIPRGIVRPSASKASNATTVAALAEVICAGSRPPSPPRAVLRGDAARRLAAYPEHQLPAATCAFAVRACHRTFFFYADTERDADRWCELISRLSAAGK